MSTIKKRIPMFLLALAMMVAMAVPTFAADFSSVNSNDSSNLWKIISENPNANISVEIPHSTPYAFSDRSSYSSTVSISRNSNLMSAWRTFNGSNYTCEFSSVRWSDPTLDDTATASGSLTVKIGKKSWGSFSEIAASTKNFYGTNSAPSRPNFNITFNGAGSGERAFSFSTKNVAFNSDITMRN